MAIVEAEKPIGKKKPGSNHLRKTYKQKLALNPQTISELRFLSAIMCCLWNKALVYCEQLLEDKRNATQDTPSITAFTLNYWLTSIKNDVVTLSDATEVKLSDVSTDAMRELLRKLAGSWQSYFELRKKKDTKARPPQVKDGTRFQTLSWSTPSMSDNKVLLAGYEKQRIVIPLPDYLRKQLIGKTVKHVTIAYHSEDSAFYLNVVCTVGAIPTVSEQPTFIRAIDLGAGDIAIADSNGNEFLIKARRGDKYWRPAIQEVEKRTEKRTKGSRRYKKLMTVRRVMFDRSEHQHASHQRKLANALVDTSKVQCIVLGKPHVRLGLSRSIKGTADQHWGSQNTGYMHQLARFIKEKAQERGVKIVEFPDPQRVGSMRDPEAKLVAARSLLKEASQRFSLPTPERFNRKGFRFER